MRLRAIGLSIVLASGLTGPAFAQAPDDVIVPQARTHPIVGKSDQHRVVGKVVAIDRVRVRVKLATEDEGVLDIAAPRMTVNAARVGDIVSIPRGDSFTPSASPRH
jgi:hypothetical protein